MSADELIHYWPHQDARPSECGVDILRTPYTYGSPEWSEVTCADCLTGRPTTGPTVPNWIGRAVILYASAACPITSWRATRTQVIVKARPVADRGEAEYRFYLDGLRGVGHRYDGVALAADDDPRVLKVQRRRKLDAARYEALGAVEQMRLQDSTEDLDLVLTKLETVRQAVVKAQAMLADEIPTGHTCGLLKGERRCETCERES